MKQSTPGSNLDPEREVDAESLAPVDARAARDVSHGTSHGMSQDGPDVPGRSATGEWRLDAAQLNAICDAIDLAVAAFDHRWRYIYVNDQAARTIGVPREDVLGRDLWEDESLRGTDYARVLREAMRAREPVTVEHFIERMRAWFEVRAFPLSPHGIVVTYRDITQRKAWEVERGRLFAEARAASLAEEARANELDAAFDALTDSAVIFDAEGRVIRANRALYAILGIDAASGLVDARLAERLSRFAPRDDQGRPLPQDVWPIARLLKGERIDDRHPFETNIELEDGQVLTVSITGAPLRDGTGHIVGAVGIVRDITERGRLLHALAENEAKYRAVFEESAIGLARVALDGRFIEVNQELCAIVGYPCGELLSLTFQDITYPSDLESDLALADQLAKGEIPNYTLDKRYERKDGTLVWVQLTAALVRDDQGAPQYFIAAIKNIDERKQLEDEREALFRAELQARQEALTSETRFETLVATLPQLILMISADGQRITYANARWRVYTGMAAVEGSPAQVLGEIIHPDDFERTMITRGAAVESGHGTTVEARYRRKDGAYRWHLINFQPVRDIMGTITGWFAAMTDIDELKQTHEHLKALTETLEERVNERTVELAEANRDLDAFARTAAHDLRAPLRGMEGFAQALLEDYGAVLDPLARRYAERITRAAHTMDQLIQDLLAYAQLSRTDVSLTSVPLARALAAAREHVANVAAQRHARIETTEPLPEVCANLAVLTSVLANLLSNAMLYVAPDTRPKIQIQAEPRVEGGQGVVRLWIRDNGIGIAPEHQQRIFEPFERLHGAEAYPGTGIGLATVRRAVERMGGRVGVNSALGEGSQFWIELPVPEGQQRAHEDVTSDTAGRTLTGLSDGP